NLPRSQQLDYSDTTVEGVECGVKVPAAVLRVSPDPANELEVEPLRTTHRLDLASVVSQRALERTRGATPPRKRQDNHRVSSLESDLKGAPIVPVHDPLLTGSLVGNNLGPLFPRRLDPAWLPVDAVQVNDGKARTPPEFYCKCRLASTA